MQEKNMIYFYFYPIGLFSLQTAHKVAQFCSNK